MLVSNIFTVVILVDEWWRLIHDFNFVWVKIIFHSSLTSELMMHMNKKMNMPCREFETVNKIWKVSLNPRTEAKLRIAKSHVSPNMNIIPPILTTKRTRLFLSNIISLAFLLSCRRITTITQTKTITLNIMMAKIGARKAPQKAPAWDRKQLCLEKVDQFTVIIIIIIFGFHTRKVPLELETLVW